MVDLIKNLSIYHALMFLAASAIVAWGIVVISLLKSYPGKIAKNVVTADPVVEAFSQNIESLSQELVEVKREAHSSTEKMISKMGRIKVNYGPVYEETELTNDKLCPRYNSRCKKDQCVAWLADGRCNDLMLNFTNVDANAENS